MKVLFDILEIKEFLKTLNSKEKKIKYQNELKNEFQEICYYYTDDNIEKYIEKHNLTEKYKRIKYSYF